MKRILSLILALILALSLITAGAEEFTLWVMCKPNTYVNVRYTPKKERADLRIPGQRRQLHE